jgi:hypothetical protein
MGDRNCFLPMFEISNNKIEDLLVTITEYIVIHVDKNFKEGSLF